MRTARPVNPTKLTPYLNRFPQVRLLVLGDVMLDHYLWGRVDRISPEAPVPVVAVTHESVHLGGAANVAQNIASLGGRVELCGIVGNDDHGRRIMSELKRQKIRMDGVLFDLDRPTTQKTRVIAHNQQVVRFDREQGHPISEKIERALVEYLQQRIGHLHGIVISDYAKGVITAGLMEEVIGLARRSRVPVLVDPKVKHIPYYKGASVITPNAAEAVGATGIDDRTDDGLARAGHALLKQLDCDAILITRGEQGMSLFEKKGPMTHIPTVAREVYDVTGAGDTVIGTLALGLCAGAPIREAAYLANCAAGIVVGIVGTATVEPETLSQFLTRSPSS